MKTFAVSTYRFSADGLGEYRYSARMVNVNTGILRVDLVSTGIWGLLHAS